VIPLEPNLDTPGPIGRSVTDVAVLLTALAGVDRNDPKTSDAAALAGTDFTRFLSLEEARKVRVGVVIPDRTAGALLGLDFATLSPDEQRQALQQLQPVLQTATEPIIEALERQGIQVVRINESDLPAPAPLDIHGAYLNYGFKAAIERLLGGLPEPAPVESLAEIVATIDADAAARAPYGQRLVQAAAATDITAAQYQAAVQEAQRQAQTWIIGILQSSNVDVVLYGVNYIAAGPAGMPAINVPIGRRPGSNEPAGVYLTGGYLSDAKLLAVAYALEQALKVQLTPDLEATIQQIGAATGR
jgi:amidase